LIDRILALARPKLRNCLSQPRVIGRAFHAGLIAPAIQLSFEFFRLSDSGFHVE
jgi:hypothetical protein